MDEEFFKNKYRVATARLKYWDYSADGYYFVTICTKNNINYFGRVVNNKMYLSKLGLTVQKYWREIPSHFCDVYLDEFIIMPNHIHGIVIINRNKIINDEMPFIGFNEGCVRRDEAMPRLRPCHEISKPVVVLKKGIGDENQIRGVNRVHGDEAVPRLYHGRILPKPGSLPVIIGSFKSIIAKSIRRFNLEFCWQGRYYDHIIKDETALFNIREYIKNNPEKWEFDHNFPKPTAPNFKAGD